MRWQDECYWGAPFSLLSEHGEWLQLLFGGQERTPAEVSGSKKRETSGGNIMADRSGPSWPCLSADHESIWLRDSYACDGDACASAVCSALSRFPGSLNQSIAAMLRLATRGSTNGALGPNLAHIKPPM